MKTLKNVLYLESYTHLQNYKKSCILRLPLESFIAYFVYKYCRPNDLQIYFLYFERSTDETYVEFSDENVQFADKDAIPWQVSSCLYPVVFCEDTISTGLCAVSRHICKYRNSKQSPLEYDEGLLGFRKGCLQAPNEVSIWTKFCEVDLLKTVIELLSVDSIKEVPINLIRFENHLNKPVKMHNIYKIARDMQKNNEKLENKKVEEKGITHSTRIPKGRKWKSNAKDQHNIDTTLSKFKELHLSHKYSEGPFLTLADLVLLPSYYILVKLIGEDAFQTFLPLTYKWFLNLLTIQEIIDLKYFISLKPFISLDIDNLTSPITVDVSLYKSDPKRHNPKRRLFTKPDDIERALNAIADGMELEICTNVYDNKVNWDSIPDGASPFAGHLPDDRTLRKSQQLENLTLAVLAMAKDNDIIVDFCSGSGHLGILIAYLLPKTTVILLEIKEQSLLRARERVHELGIRNVFFFQCNLDFFIGKFDIGVALHACGVASDLVLDKCLKSNAKFVICPCCYGSLHATDRLVYPRSSTFKNLNIDQYLCIGHTADQTHKDHPLTQRGMRCMAIIDSDRARLAEELGYKVSLTRLKPNSCTDKNNLLIGLPS